MFYKILILQKYQILRFAKPLSLVIASLATHIETKLNETPPPLLAELLIYFTNPKGHLTLFTNFIRKVPCFPSRNLSSF